MDEPPAEDALVIPDTWRRVLHPRRGGVPGPPIEIDARAGAVLREHAARKRAELDRGVRPGTGGDPEIVAAVRDHLDGRPGPLGAAAVAYVLFSGTAGPPGPQEGRPPRWLADAWVSEHGVPFAAAACAEACALETAANRSADTRTNPASAIARATAFSSRDDGFLQLAARMRAILAAADEHDYQEAVARLAGHRRTEPQRVIVSFLVPTRQDWTDECRVVTEPRSPYARMLWCSFGDARQAGRMRGWPLDGNGALSLDVLATAAEGIGARLVPVLLRALNAHPHPGPDRRVLLEVLSAMPSDEALAALIERRGETLALEALTAAMDRYPVRALRLLADTAAAEQASRRTAKDTQLSDLLADLLTWHLRAHPEPAAAERHRPAVARVLDAETRAEPAAPGDLPRVLAEPPWTREREKRGDPRVIELDPPGERALVWAPGERESWARAASPSGRWYAGTGHDWPAAVKSCREEPAGYAIGHLIAEGPEDLVRPLLSEWHWHARDWEAADGVWMRAVVARHGFDALPAALHAARANPGGCGKPLLPYLDDEVAALMAGRLARLKSARPTAVAWFGRHGAAAARALIPYALAPASKPPPRPDAAAAGRDVDRRDAERALRLIASDIGTEAVVDAARSYGRETAGAIAALLSTDPLDILPPRIPKLPAWADPAVLPQVLLNGRARALPTTAPLLVMLAISKPGEPYAGLETVRETCDPESLAEFGWSLFMRWHAHGEPSRHSWALHQLGWTGNDRTVRRLTPFIRAWPGEGGHRKAVTGLDVLAEIGTDVALTHLHGCTRRLRFKGLKARAAEKIDDIAAARGLTPSQLADRTVPDFGLSAEGALTLDYGPRRFVVGFDEQLNPHITDESGARRKVLPRASAGDDRQLATAARQRYTALRKEVKAVAEAQIRRLEAAMVDRRRWSAAEFRDLFAAHPLLWHIVRRLVWLSEDGGKTTAFRLAEDRTLADADDAVLTLAESAAIGLAHPADLGGRLDDWRQTFDDYELLQPFPQLDRPVAALTPAERRATRLARFENLLVDPAGLAALRARGWTRRTPDGAYVDDCLFRPAHPSGFVILNLSQNHDRTEKVTGIWHGARPGPYSPGLARPLSDLHPATASELLTALAAHVRRPEPP